MFFSIIAIAKYCRRSDFRYFPLFFSFLKIWGACLTIIQTLQWILKYRIMKLYEIDGEEADIRVLENKIDSILNDYFAISDSLT